MYDGIYIKPAFEIPEIERKIYGSSFTGDNSVHLLWKNGNCLKLYLIPLQAERFVCLEFYIFRNDETGIELAELLKRKPWEESVYTCFMTTSALSEPFGNSGAELKKPGINVRASYPFKWTAPLHYVLLTTKKLILIGRKKHSQEG